jgi:hypothetical protein
MEGGKISTVLSREQYQEYACRNVKPIQVDHWLYVALKQLAQQVSHNWRCQHSSEPTSSIAHMHETIDRSRKYFTDCSGDSKSKEEKARKLKKYFSYCRRIDIVVTHPIPNESCKCCCQETHTHHHLQFQLIQLPMCNLRTQNWIWQKSCVDQLQHLMPFMVALKHGSY